eukprot:SAG31_NODE_21386_length_551_cov_0.714602_2_plen_60_part_01
MPHRAACSIVFSCVKGEHYATTRSRTMHPSCTELHLGTRINIDPTIHHGPQYGWAASSNR